MNLGVVVLLVKAANAGRVDQIAAFGIFGFSLIVLYLASTLYHLSPLTSAGVARLRRVDHMMIFVLIAGTYSPFCVLALDDAWRVGLLQGAWPGTVSTTKPPISPLLEPRLPQPVGSDPGRHLLWAKLP